MDGAAKEGAEALIEEEEEAAAVAAVSEVAEVGFWPAIALLIVLL